MSMSKKLCMVLLGSAVQAYGLYNIHSISGVTEGGILGLGLLFENWWGLSPALTTLVLNFICYLIGFFVLGGGFILLSAAAGAGFSLVYALLEMYPRVYPAIAGMPFWAAVLGALFIGVGVGISVRAGGAPGGDDALAMSITKLTGISIKWIYLVSDLIVLGLSLSYIPAERIGWSLLTVVLSGQIIDFIAVWGKPKKKEE